MSYHIEINEYQRRLIMKALTCSGDAFDTEAKEFVCRLVRSTSTIPPRGAEALFRVQMCV